MFRVWWVGGREEGTEQQCDRNCSLFISDIGHKDPRDDGNLTIFGRNCAFSRTNRAGTSTTLDQRKGA